MRWKGERSFVISVSQIREWEIASHVEIAPEEGAWG